ncbi:hypothetical protein VTK26DRAFT_2467 [Humicola hyalothermophila]
MIPRGFLSALPIRPNTSHLFLVPRTVTWPGSEVWMSVPSAPGHISQFQRRNDHMFPSWDLRRQSPHLFRFTFFFFFLIWAAGLCVPWCWGPFLFIWGRSCFFVASPVKNSPDSVAVTVVAMPGLGFWRNSSLGFGFSFFSVLCLILWVFPISLTLFLLSLLVGCGIWVSLVGKREKRKGWCLLRESWMDAGVLVVGWLGRFSFLLACVLALAWGCCFVGNY